MMKKIIKTLLAMMVMLSGLTLSSQTILARTAPNLSGAQTIAIGATFQDATNDNYGSDVYKVYLEKSGTLNVSIEFFNIDSYVVIYDVNGIELQSDYISYNSAFGSSKANLDYPLTKGSYYIAVYPDSYYGYQYRMSTSYKGSGESFIETNGGTNNYLYQASKVKTNKTYYGQIGYNDKRDLYEFTLSKKTTVTINVEAKFSGATYGIYDEDGNTLYSKNGGWYSNAVSDTTNKFKLKEKVTLNKGTYYFSVTGFDQKQHKYYGNYSFKLSIPVVKYKIKYQYDGKTYGTTTLQYGKTYTLKANQFKKTGYHFVGWTLQRASDNKFLYTNGKTTKWYKEGKQPSGYAKKVYKNKASIKNLSTKNGETLTFHARLTKNSFTVKYHANGGTGSMKQTIVKYGNATALRSNTFKKSGYQFEGWTCYRSSDKKWYYTNGKSYGWYKEGKQPSGYKKVVYKNKAKVAKTTSVQKDNVHMFARWKKK